MTSSGCAKVVDCLQQLVSVTDHSSSNFSETATAAAGVLVALAAVVISIVVANAQRRRNLREERQRLRSDLRRWFDGLSASAVGEIRDGHRKLDSQIKEDIRAVGRHEIRRLMNWASLVHQHTQAMEVDQATREEAHARRMYAKWIFRDLLAEWALRPSVTRLKIWHTTRHGYELVGKIEISNPAHLGGSLRPFDSRRNPSSVDQLTPPRRYRVSIDGKSSK